MSSLARTSMSNRLLSMPMRGDPRDPREVHEYQFHVMSIIKRSPILNLDNVEEYAATNGKPRTLRKVGNWTPPWASFFAEWNMFHATEHEVGQFGVLVNAFDFDDPKQAKEYVHCFGVPKIDNEYRWMLATSIFWASRRRACGNGVPNWAGGAIVAVGRGGEFRGLMSPYSHDSKLNETVATIEYMLGFGISLCHCKNVSQRTIESSKPQKWHDRHNVPKLSYRVLQIDAIGNQSSGTASGACEGGKRSLHICRGHFATYTKARPLFGKYVGTFWIPDHVKGSKKYGEVVKDYKIAGAALEGTP